MLLFQAGCCFSWVVRWCCCCRLVVVLDGLLYTGVVLSGWLLFQMGCYILLLLFQAGCCFSRVVVHWCCCWRLVVVSTGLLVLLLQAGCRGGRRSTWRRCRMRRSAGRASRCSRSSSRTMGPPSPHSNTSPRQYISVCLSVRLSVCPFLTLTLSPLSLSLSLSVSFSVFVRPCLVC